MTYSRRSNIKFDGIPGAKTDSKTIIRDILSNVSMNADDIVIERAHRIGPFMGQNKSPRTLIVRFCNYCDREAVWGNRTLLKGIHLGMINC